MSLWKTLTGRWGHELIMDQAGLSCLRWVAASAGWLNFEMQWYEHTDKN